METEGFAADKGVGNFDTTTLTSSERNLVLILRDKMKMQNSEAIQISRDAHSRVDLRGVNLHFLAPVLVFLSSAQSDDDYQEAFSKTLQYIADSKDLGMTENVEQTMRKTFLRYSRLVDRIRGKIAFPS